MQGWPVLEIYPFLQADVPLVKLLGCSEMGEGRATIPTPAQIGQKYLEHLETQD